MIGGLEHRVGGVVTLWLGTRQSTDRGTCSDHERRIAFETKQTSSVAQWRSTAVSLVEKKGAIYCRYLLTPQNFHAVENEAMRREIHVPRVRPLLERPEA